MSARVFGNGGPNGSRVFWPAGFGSMTPVERAEALKRGWWRDGEHVITADGRRMREGGIFAEQRRRDDTAARLRGEA